MVEPIRWSRDQLESARRRAIELFRRERLEEPLELYLEAFDEYQGKIEDLLESTVDLSTLAANALAILTDRRLRVVFRYLAGPPISTDDLTVLAEAESLSPGHLRENPELVQRVLRTVEIGLDRRRFPWIAENREPTEAERSAAVLATASLIATQQVATNRRTQGKVAQERQVREGLRGHGFQEVNRRNIGTIAEAPQPGEFCPESRLGSRKADQVAGLWDRRILPIECKVSNSELNSIKRLNNDAAVKAGIWKREFGERQVVPTAVLSGVYSLASLETAQDAGLMLFWAHDLSPLLEWIDATRQDVERPGRG